MEPKVKSACETCAHFNAEGLKKLGVNTNNFDFVVALAGNPNTGKSTVFNALTGLRQHTGNWPGKTVTRAEGGFEYNYQKYKLVDLPGTYSLLSTSEDEEAKKKEAADAAAAEKEAEDKAAEEAKKAAEGK